MLLSTELRTVASRHYDEGMEVRIAKLEEFATDAQERLVKIESRLDQTATKTDVSALQVEMHKGFSDMIKWVVGTAIVLGGTAITVMTFVLNNAMPKAAPTAPAIYYVQPASVAPPPTAPPTAPPPKW